MIRQNDFQIIHRSSSTSISQKLHGHIFSMWFVALFKKLFFFSIAMHKRYYVKNTNMYMHIAHILW